MAWLVLLAITCLLALIVGKNQTMDMEKLMIRFSSRVFLPALILGPMALILAQGLLAANLVFPVSFGLEPWRAFLWLAAPSIVLFFSSGLMTSLCYFYSTSRREWLSKPCAQFYEALGISAFRRLAPLILALSWVKAWARSIPWIFGELIIIESLFNAQGVAYQLWRGAREHQPQLVLQSLLILLLIYFVFQQMNSSLGAWLGKRLQSYG